MPSPLFAPRRIDALAAPAASLPPAGYAPTTHARTNLDRGRAAASLLLFVGAVYTALALCSYQTNPALPQLEGANWVGPVGAAWANVLVGAVGVIAWSVPIECLLLAWPLLKNRASIATVARLAGDLLVALILAALVEVAAPSATAFGSVSAAGSIGELFGELFRSLFSTVGSFLLGLTAVALILIGRASFSFIAWAERATRGTEVAATKAASSARAVAGVFERASEIKRAQSASRDEKGASGGAVVEPLARLATPADPHDSDSLVDALGDETPAASGATASASQPPGASEPASTQATQPTQAVQRRGRARSVDRDDANRANASSPTELALNGRKVARRSDQRSTSEPETPALAEAPRITTFAFEAPRARTEDGATSDDNATERRTRGRAPRSVSEAPSTPVSAPVPVPAPLPATARASRAAAKRSARAEADEAAGGGRARSMASDADAWASPSFPAIDADAADDGDADTRESSLLDPSAGVLSREVAPEGAMFSLGEPSPEPPVVAPARVARVAPVVQTAPTAPRPKVIPAIGAGFRLPKPDLLEASVATVARESPEALVARAKELEKVLANYGVKGGVVDIHTGPTVSTFEVVPAEGTKVSKVAGLADDLALGLSCTVRIIAPIPGKSRIGFELPNRERIPVNLRELVEDARFIDSTVPLPVVLGRDIVGAPFFADLASMPHVIVAGATGAGKSVGLNVMLTSLLTRRSPEELRLLMIDPKVVELAPFDRIPHMLLPVVTDMKQAANALKWAVDEMERRYQLFGNAGTKNITTYNGWVERAQRGEVRAYVAPKPIIDQAPDGSLIEQGPTREAPPLPEKLPYIVLVVDEFADLMMQQGKEVEAAVARLAQKARAAGMHVILATQRPSVDVITGMIKANFPTRIAFRVAQRVDSRTILDEQGAEHLLGRGDMLVKLNGTNDTRRVQCPFVSEEEVQRVCDFLRSQGEPVYDESILKARDDGDSTPEDDGELDAKYDEAVRVVADTRRCSTSWLQRKLGLGYNRAAKIVEVMERRGIVGPANGSKDREVLLGQL